MYAVEFRANITDGKIDIPDEYLQALPSSEVKVLILCENPAVAPKKAVAHRKKSIKGNISNYASPELIPLEKEAWGEAVKEKHVCSLWI